MHKSKGAMFSYACIGRAIEGAAEDERKQIIKWLISRAEIHGEDLRTVALQIDLKAHWA